MKKLAKALLIAKIKAREKIRPQTWATRKASPWDKRQRKSGGGNVQGTFRAGYASGGIVWDAPVSSEATSAVPDAASVKWDDATRHDSTENKFGWQDTWPIKAAKSVYSALTLPGDVMAGKAHVPGSEDAQAIPGAVPFGSADSSGERIADLAMIGNPASVAEGTGAAIAREAGLGKPIKPPTPVEQTPAAASERLGVPISKAAISESPTIQSAAGALKEIPFVGTPLVKSAKSTLQGLDTAAKDTAAAYGSGDAVTAGEAAKEGLEGWITGKSGDIAKRVYGKVDDMINPSFTRPLHSTADTVADIMAKRSNSRISGTSPAVNEVQEAISDPAGLDYEGVKGLRTYIRDMTPQEMTAKGINPQEAKRIYNSLTEDLRGTILDGGGPEALSTFDKANGIYSQIADRRAGLAKVIGVKADAAPERVMERLMQLAGSKGGADLTKLVQARRAIGSDKWNEVTSAVVNRMGRASPEAEFSGDRFVTAWNNLSENGKRTLFNSTGKPELAKNVEDIMTLSQSYKQLAKMGNPSGTGRVNTILSSLGALGGALAGTVTIGLAAPLAMLGTALGGRTVAAILSKPVLAKSAASWTNAYVNAVKTNSPIALATLASTSSGLMKDIRKYGLLQGPDAQQYHSNQSL